MLETVLEWWNTLAGAGPATLFGGVAGGILGAVAVLVVTWLSAREAMARHLLSEALRIQALREAWIVVGTGWKSYELRIGEPLPTKPELSDDGQLALYPVEVRAVLDRPVWNGASDQSYAFIAGRRTWIVRAKLVNGLSYGDRPDHDARPAILSSHGFEELCGWIEQVTSAERFPWLLSSDASRMLLPILPAVAPPDRIAALKRGLSAQAQSFLEKYRAVQKHVRDYEPGA